MKRICVFLAAAILLISMFPALPLQSLAIPVKLTVATDSGTNVYNFGSVTEALDYLNNTLGYDGYLWATIEVAPTAINENFTDYYVLHDLAITGSGADQTLLYNASGTGGLVFKNSNNITITKLTIANMTTGIAFTSVSNLGISDLGLENLTSKGLVIEGADNVDIHNIHMANVAPSGGYDTGIYLEDVDTAAIRDTYFLDTGYPVIAQYISSLEIINTTIIFEGLSGTDAIQLLNIQRALVRDTYLEGNYAESIGIYAETVKDLVIEDFYAHVYWYGIYVVIPYMETPSSLILRNIAMNYCPQSVSVFNFDPGATILLHNVSLTAVEPEDEEVGLIYGVYLYGYVNGTRIDLVSVEDATWWFFGPLGKASAPTWTHPAPTAKAPEPSIPPETYMSGGIILAGYMEGASLGNMAVRNSLIGIVVAGGSPEPDAGPQHLYISSVTVENNTLDIYSTTIEEYEGRPLAAVPLKAPMLYPSSVSIATNNILISGETALIKVVEGEGIYWVGKYLPEAYYGYDNVATSNGLPPLPEGLVDTGIRLEVGAGEGSHVVIGVVYPQGLINRLGIDESGLTAYHYNDTSGEWEPLPTTVDTVNNVAYVTLSETGSPVILLGPPLPAGVGGKLLASPLIPAPVLVVVATVILGVALAAAIRSEREEKR